MNTKTKKYTKKHTKKHTKTKKYTKKYTENGDIGLPVEYDIFLYNPNFKTQFKCNYNEYYNLTKPEFSYVKYYKPYESGQQFKALVQIAFKYNPVILSRLLEIALKRFHPRLTNVIYNILISNKSDEEIYGKLRKLYKNPQNRFNIKKSNTCKGNIAIQEWMVRYLKIANMQRGVNEITKYLDIGCGNGNFAISLGQLLGLDKKDIFGVDLADFSEQGDWGRHRNMDKFTFQELKYNQPYPFEDNTFDLITIKMVLHHVSNLDFTLKEITRVLKINGALIIVEHDSFTYADYMINDIEHGFYINVFNLNTSEENFINLSLSQSNKKIKSIDVNKYYSWPEHDYILRKNGFEYIRKQLYSNNINFSMGASRAFFYLYKLHNKNDIPANHTF
jgi:ubiquinone/menaquinone biosynthesis C-methylase UbiE